MHGFNNYWEFYQIKLLKIGKNVKIEDAQSQEWHQVQGEGSIREI